MPALLAQSTKAASVRHEHVEGAGHWVHHDQLDRFLESRGVPHAVAPVWTTDGLFRETPDRVARRRAEGCLLVDMECSALAAVAAFRGVRFGQLLYAGDSLAAAEWDHRGWNRADSVRDSLLDLAIDAVRGLA